MNIIKSLLTILSVFILMLLSCGNPTTTDDGPVTGTITDIEGNIYQTVKIGNQWWMAENLRTTKYNDGTPIPHVKDSAEWWACTAGTAAYCYYDNDSASYAEKYGALYNWHAVNTDKLAPYGWHVPDSADWDILQNYLIANGYNWDGTTDTNTYSKIAKSMAAKTDWSSSGEEGDVGNNLSTNNRSGFSALPGGYRDINGSFNLQGDSGLWWSSTEADWSRVWSRGLRFNYPSLGMYPSNKALGFSVRCVMD